MKKIGNLLNKLLKVVGCQIVSTHATRHIHVLKDILEKKGDLNVLELAIQKELLGLKGKPFNFIQIGANDGGRYDPYRQHIEKYQLSGVLVEPNPAVFGQLIKNYQDQPQLSFENSAIGPSLGKMPLYFLRDPLGSTDDLSVFASLSKEDIQKSKKWLKRDLIIDSIEVPIITITALLEKYNIDNVSLLAVDTEGFDYEILKSVDFAKVRPSIIEYEHSHLSLADEKKCHDLLIREGYKLYRSLGDDTLAIMKK